VLSVLSACKKDYQDNPLKPTENTADLQVPAGFDWKTTKDVRLEISLPADGFYPLHSKISVYQGNPYQNGTKLTEGSLSREQNFTQCSRISGKSFSLSGNQHRFHTSHRGGIIRESIGLYIPKPGK
jgi:hypothetical protein